MGTAAGIPYPLTAEDIGALKQQVWELIRQLFEERIGGLEIGDVFTDAGGMLVLNLAALSGLDSSGNALSIDLDGTSLQITANGLKVGQSAHISDPTGGTTIDAQCRATVQLILDLLEARGLMAV